MEIGSHFTQLQKAFNNASVFAVFAVRCFTTNPGSGFGVAAVGQAVGLVLEVVEGIESIDLFCILLEEELLELVNLGARLFVELLELEDVVSDGAGVHIGRHCEMMTFTISLHDLSAIKDFGCNEYNEY
tara:strand:+ start:6098 stop:6484 length:387 start_codon:yes stop_codon:yes gene_type:complete